MLRKNSQGWGEERNVKYSNISAVTLRVVHTRSSVLVRLLEKLFGKGNTSHWGWAIISVYCMKICGRL